MTNINALGSIKSEQVQRELKRREDSLDAQLRNLLNSLIMSKDFVGSKTYNFLLQSLSIAGSRIVSFEYDHDKKYVYNIQYEHPTTVGYFA